MSKKMLIDASHQEETRVVVLEDGELVEFQHEITGKVPLKGNIFLAKVIRVEPSLQAAFLDYGGNRHGFLGFNEIHPDYYKIPIADRQAILASCDNYDENNGSLNDDAEGTDHGGDDFDLAAAMGVKRFRLKHKYKIQEVIKRGQVMLVQAVKEERGNKGAAMTTFISLAGRYCVLMPNSGKGGGISRRINDEEDRKRLKDIVASLDVPDSMALILRTAGAGRTKSEIKRDYEYLDNLWADIRKITIDSQAPTLVHEDVNILWRSIRDVYDKDTEKVIISGDDAYQKACEYMKMLIPTHVKNVIQHKEDSRLPMFQEHNVETLLASMYQPNVFLPSGGYIVIEQTEAMVSIDVNSGKATQERHIEETAYNTNVEAAEMIALQMRLRDLSGLVIIDFIDMEDRRNNNALERYFKDAVSKDRARMQINRISSLGLLEMTRQRLNPSLSEITSSQCPHCYGTGKVLNINATALMMIRSLEEEAIRGKGRVASMSVQISLDVAIYIFNSKRKKIHEIEIANNLTIAIEPEMALPMAAIKLYATSIIDDEGEVVELTVDKYEELFNNYEQSINHYSRRGRGRNRGGRNRGGRNHDRDEAERDHPEGQDDSYNANDNDQDKSQRKSYRNNREDRDSSRRSASRGSRGRARNKYSQRQSSYHSSTSSKKKGLLWRIIG